MKSNDEPRLSEPLPFRNYRLSSEHCAHVERRLRRWCDEHSFGDERFVEVARVYLEFCSPDQPSLSGLDLLTDYLSWFFLLNDLPVGPEKTQQLSAAREAFHGVAFDGSLVATATAEFCQTIRERFGERDRMRLERRLSELLEALCWEDEHTSYPPPAFEIFSTYREHTIADYPYLELWRLGEGFSVPGRYWPAFAELERLNARIIYITNDVLSAPRDRRLGKMNTLFCMMNEQRIDLRAAQVLFLQQLDTLVNRFASLARSVQLENSANSAATYVDFLGSNLEGNRLTMFALAERYRLANDTQSSLQRAPEP